MNIRNVSNFVVALVLSAGLSVLPEMVDSSEAAQRKCKAEETRLKTASREEKKAESSFNRELRKLESLQRRYDRDLENKERKAEKCIEKTERLNDSYTAQLDNAERARQNYISKSGELAVQRIACELDAATGGPCNPNRFYTALAKMAKDILKAEQRIATLRDLLAQKLQTQKNACIRENTRFVTLVARSLGRVDVQTPKVTAKQGIFTAKTAIREAAEAAVAQCQAANP